MDHAKALNYLGIKYIDGLIENNEVIIEKNMKIAIDFIRRSADLGNSDAICFLATYYEKGVVDPFETVLVEKDQNKAIHYYTKAVELKNADSMYFLALCYQTGNGVEMDFKKWSNYGKNHQVWGTIDQHTKWGCATRKVKVLIKILRMR